MTEYTINLHNTDTERLFACKALEGKHALTGNEYAALLLERELHRLFPAVPRIDEEGQLLNGHYYTGPRPDPEPAPEERYPLYHYTSFDNLPAILESGQLKPPVWLSGYLDFKGDWHKNGLPKDKTEVAIILSPEEVEGAELTESPRLAEWFKTDKPVKVDRSTQILLRPDKREYMELYGIRIDDYLRIGDFLDRYGEHWGHKVNTYTLEEWKEKSPANER